MQRPIPILAALIAILSMVVHGASEPISARGLDSLLVGIERLDYEARGKRWFEILHLVESDPTARTRIEQIASGQVRAGNYQRFVASSHVAGFGYPRTCGPTGADNIALFQFLGLFRGNPKPGYIYKIDCDPRIATLRLQVPPVPGERTVRTIQDTLWDTMTKYHLDFRILHDSTFYIFPSLPDI